MAEKILKEKRNSPEVSAESQLAEASQRIEALQAQLAERDKELHDTTLAWAAAADDRDEANGLREAAEAKVEALTARASTLEDAAFHFQTCRTCAEDGEDSCTSGRKFSGFLRGEPIDGD